MLYLCDLFSILISIFIMINRIILPKKTHFFCLFHIQLFLDDKGSFKKYVHWESKHEQKQTGWGGWGLLVCVYVRFLKKNAEIFKIKFYSYSPSFPIDYNGSVKY